MSLKKSVRKAKSDEFVAITAGILGRDLKAYTELRRAASIACLVYDSGVFGISGSFGTAYSVYVALCDLEVGSAESTDLCHAILMEYGEWQPA